MKSVWENLWIVFSWGLAVHKISPKPVEVNIREDNKEYTVKFSQTDEITSSGSLLFSSIYNHSKRLLQNKSLAKLDDSLVLYFDMETIINSWSELVLKDFSKYHNNWKLKWWIKIWTEEWVNWKATYFDWVDDYIDVLNHSSISNIKNLTSGFSVSFNKNVWNVTGVWVVLWKYSFSLDKWWIFWALPDWKVFFDWRNWNDTYYSNLLNSNLKWQFHTYSSSYTDDWIESNWILYVEWNRKINNKHLSGSIINDVNFLLWRFSTNFFNWTVDEVRIYNRALSEEETKNVYGSTLKN